MIKNLNTENANVAEKMLDLYPAQESFIGIAATINASGV